MTTLILSKCDPMNTNLSYEDGTVAYIVKSDWKMRDTEITKANGEQIAKITWRTFHDNTVVINGREMKISEWMPGKKSLLSCNRYFKNSAGEEFEWKMGRKLYCVATANDANVATYYRSSMGIIGKKHPAYIDIAQQMTGELDLVVITCMIMAITRYIQEVAAAAS